MRDLHEWHPSDVKMLLVVIVMAFAAIGMSGCMESLRSTGCCGSAHMAPQAQPDRK
jgi:hypothetical protein